MNFAERSEQNGGLRRDRKRREREKEREREREPDTQESIA